MAKQKKKKFTRLYDQLELIRKQAKKFEKKYDSALKKIHPLNLKSAKNFIHYLALRNQEIRELQNTLWQLGISRFGRAESHVMASLISVQNIVKVILTGSTAKLKEPEITFKESRKLSKKNTSALLGNKLKGSKVRIMVTIPTEAADDYRFIKKLFKAGMNSARINCAHDDPLVWGKMVKNIEKAKKQTGRNCKICMDLGGPKLRTGAMRKGPKVLHLTPDRDLLGNVTSPAESWLVPEGTIAHDGDQVNIPIPAAFLSVLKPKDEIHFSDSRGKSKKLIIDRKFAGKRLSLCYESAYIKTGTIFTLKNNRKSNRTTAPVGELLPLEESIILKVGDKLIIHKDPATGEPAEFSPEGKLIEPAHISCTLPEIFDDIKPGEPIVLDDGKIEGIINDISDDKFEIEITYAKDTGSKLRADKGINLPESDLSLTGLTEKDRADLKFVAKYADVVNFSFVNSPEDVNELIKELKNNDAEHLGIILKIETKKAFENLPSILLAGLQHYPIGVMIARGDLAIECGWNELARVQEELLWICEAAHIPIIWATQVLETMAKKGRPSRAEITDAALAEQAECVMLNKGPFIFEAIQILDEIMRSMEDYHDKKSPLLPPLKIRKIKSVRGVSEKNLKTSG